MKKTKVVLESIKLGKEYFEKILRSEEDTPLRNMLADTMVCEKIESAKIEKSKECVYDIYSNTLFSNKHTTKEEMIKAIILETIRYTVTHDKYFPITDEYSMYSMDQKYKGIYLFLKKLELLDAIPIRYTNSMHILVRDSVDEAAII